MLEVSHHLFRKVLLCSIQSEWCFMKLWAQRRSRTSGETAEPTAGVECAQRSNQARGQWVEHTSNRFWARVLMFKRWIHVSLLARIGVCTLKPISQSLCHNCSLENKCNSSPHLWNRQMSLGFTVKTCVPDMPRNNDLLPTGDLRQKVKILIRAGKVFLFC